MTQPADTSGHDPAPSTHSRFRYRSSPAVYGRGSEKLVRRQLKQVRVILRPEGLLPERGVVSGHRVGRVDNKESEKNGI